MVGVGIGAGVVGVVLGGRVTTTGCAGVCAGGDAGTYTVVGGAGAGATGA